MGDIANGNINLDKLTAVEKLLNALTEGEDSAEERGWITAAELEEELNHD